MDTLQVADDVLYVLPITFSLSAVVLENTGEVLHSNPEGTLVGFPTEMESLVLKFYQHF
jgi:hypothetical protein